MGVDSINSDDGGSADPTQNYSKVEENLMNRSVEIVRKSKQES